MTIARRHAGRLLGSGAVLAILGILIVVPMAFIVLTSVSNGLPRPGNILTSGLTLEHFGILSSPIALGALGVSTVVSLIACVLAVTLGGALAFLCARTDVPGRRLIYLAAVSPLLLPSYVGAIAWAVLGAPGSGLINILLRDLDAPFQFSIYGYGGMIFVLVLLYAPYAFLLVYAAASLMNPDLEQVANVHGASPWRMVREVTLPLLLPAILGATVLIFSLSIENFPITYIIGSPQNIDTLPTVIYRLMHTTPNRSNEAAVIAVVLTAALLLFTLAQRRLLARRSFTTVAGKGVRPSRLRLGPWRWAVLPIPVLYFACGTLLPVLALLVVSLQRSPYLASLTQLARPGALTLNAFYTAINSPQVRQAALNTLIVSGGAALAGTAFCFFIAYLVNRTRLPGRAGFEYVAMAPLAVPAIVFGLGLLWTWLILPIPIYGTIIVLIVALLAHQMPQGYRSISASMLQIDRDLEDSAVMAGASRPRAVRYVTAPLLKVGLSGTFFLLLVLSIRELTVPLFLFTSNTRLLSIVIFDDVDNGQLQRSAAIAVLYSLAVVVLAAGAQRFRSVQGEPSGLHP